MASDPETVLYFIGLAMFIALTAIAMRSVESPVLLLCSGISITAFGAIWGCDIVNLFGTKMAKALSQSFIVFISVLGGGIVSVACAEFRQLHKMKLGKFKR